MGLMEVTPGPKVYLPSLHFIPGQNNIKEFEFVWKRGIFRLVSVSDLRSLRQMAGPRIAHATLKGPSVVKEICIGIVLGIAAGSVWKMHHWNEQRKVRAFYDLLEKGEISVVAEED